MSALDDDADAELARALAELTAEYASELPGRITALRDALARSADAAGWAAAESLAHKLRGSAGSYGFHAVSVAATDIERELIAARRADPSLAAPDERARGIIARALDALAAFG